MPKIVNKRQWINFEIDFSPFIDRDPSKSIARQPNTSNRCKAFLASMPRRSGIWVNEMKENMLCVLPSSLCPSIHQYTVKLVQAEKSQHDCVSIDV
jgi:hypothetical protein